MAASKEMNDAALLEFRRESRDWISKNLPEEWRGEYVENLGLEESRKARWEWERRIYDGGFAGLNWPIEYGGRGLGMLEEFVFNEELAGAGAPEELNHAGKVLAGPAILSHGTADQRARYLRPIVAAEELWSEGFSEPGAGSDLAGVSTTATRDGLDFRIEGRKVWTSNADVADRCFLLARTSKDLPKRHNLTVFLLDMHQDGISVENIRQISGMPEFTQVTFDGAIAKQEEVLGEENAGWKLCRIGGLARNGMLRSALFHLRMLQVWTAQLGECCAEVSAPVLRYEDARRELELLRWHLRRTAELMSMEDRWFEAASIVKLAYSELMQKVVAAGYELQCSRHVDNWRKWYLAARAATIYDGTSEIQRNVIADQILGLPR